MRNDEDLAMTVAEQLSQLLAGQALDKDEKVIAATCLRRLQQPLRAVIFGTDPKHAILLLNLLAGQSLVPPVLEKAFIRIIHSERPFAEIQLRDGRIVELKETEFRDIFADRPDKVKIGVNLPVLKKVSFMVIANPDADELCENAKNLNAADFVLWSGAELTEKVAGVWEAVPDRVRDHSHLVLSPSMDGTSWAPVREEFVETLRVDPRLAQAAKTRKGGADKVAFEEAGGTALVRGIKKEIESLRQSALDAGQVLIFRHNQEILQSSSEREEESRPLIATPTPEMTANEVEEPRRRVRFVTTRKPSADVVSIDRSERIAEVKENPDESSGDSVKATPWSLGL